MSEIEFSRLSRKEIDKKQRDFLEKAANKSLKKVDTVTQTKNLLIENKSIEEIAKIRELSPATIIDHIEKIKEKEPNTNIRHIRENFSSTRYKKIHAAFQKAGTRDGGKRPLSPVMEILGKGYSFDELRIVRLFL